MADMRIHLPISIPTLIALPADVKGPKSSAVTHLREAADD
jgi:hypothetical protein